MSRNPKPPAGSRVWYLDPPEKPSKEVIRRKKKQSVTLVFAENGPLGWKGDPVPRRLTKKGAK